MRRKDMAAQENNSAVAAVSGFFKAIGGFFADFGTAVVKGDAFVKLSLIWMGAGYAKRKQYVKAALMTLLEIAVIVFSVKFAMQYVPKFSTLGTVKMEKVFNMKTMKSEFNDYDNSFTILLFSLFSFAAEADYHIGVVSGTVSQSEDSLRGAEELVKMYGASDKGGMVTHVTYPDNFMQEMETTISQMVGLADDPKMKVILVAEAVPGTVEAFRRIREKRPDILLIANAPHEDPEIISDAADLVTNPDNVARGYLIVKAAKEMGATKFMHISFPRHLSYELLSRRRNIMAETAKDLGMSGTCAKDIGDAVAGTLGEGRIYGHFRTEPGADGTGTFGICQTEQSGTFQHFCELTRLSEKGYSNRHMRMTRKVRCPYER
jgi:hypothetical protein